jgi:hypothetical protein
MALITNLVSYWKLDEAAGARADSQGTNNLTDTNTVTSVAGIINNAARFTAVNLEDLSVADNASLAFTTALSTSFWVRQTDVGINRAFIGKWTYATDGEFAIQSGSVTASDISIFLTNIAGNDGTQCLMTFSPGMVAGNWYHVAVVYDGSLAGDANRLKVWVNNTAQTLVATSGSVVATIRDGTATFYLGRFGGTLTRYLNGDMDEVGIWNRALTATEVGQLYNGGAGLAYPLVPGSSGAGPSRFRNALRIGL